MRISLLRSDDLLALEFETVNLRLETRPGGPPVLVPQGGPPLLIVHFPPQHIAERAFSPNTSITAVKSRIAGPSQLVFRVSGELPFTLAALLDWSGPRLTAQLPLATTPLDLQSTLLELPFRILLVPGIGTSWQHDRLPVTVDDAAGSRWTELWQTRLDAAPGNRAVWAAGARLSSAPDPFSLMAIDRDSRNQIAIQSRARTAQNGRADIPVDRLSLSALGAWLDLSVAWEDIPANKVAEWRHSAAMGRDTTVRVTKRGFLMPFGHRAGLTTITERRFSADGFAALEQRNYLTVLEPEKTYDARDMPFRRVRIDTLTTPIFDQLDAGGWPIVDGQPFAFQLTGEDWMQQQSGFSLPLAFLEAGTPVPAAMPFSDDGERLDGSNGHAELDAPAASLARIRRQANLAGQAVAIAQAKAGDLSTTVATQTMDFGLASVVPLSSFDPPFRPRMDQASVDLPAVNRLLGGQGPVDIRIPTAAASNGAAQIVAEFVNSARAVATPAQQTGGFLAPALNVVGLSRTLGPVSGRGATPAAALNQIATGNFDPVSFLGETTKIFGTIDLAKVIQNAVFTATPDGDQIDVEKLVESVNAAVPAARAETMRKGLEDGANTGKLIKVPTMSSHDLRNDLGIPIGVDLTWLWKPKLKQPPGNFILFDVPNRPKTMLWMSTRIVARAGETPETRVEGHLTEFDLSLLSVMSVQFKRLRFTVESGKKAEVHPEIGEITFAGKLNFVNKLKDVLAAIGVDSPFSVDIQPTFATASYSLGLPTISMGAFALENVRLSTALTLPFVESAGPVRIRFAVAERSAPFLVTYAIFAGGGFFAVVLDTRGDLALEASIEFGGKLAIDLVVAKGGVYALAGIYFSLKPGEGVVLEAYLRAGGFVEILGIVTLSIEFYLSLTYVEAGNKLVGKASVTACIEVLFFSECVTFEVKREIAGPSLAFDADRQRTALLDADEPRQAGGVGFGDLVDLEAWTSYCEAFA